VRILTAQKVLLLFFMLPYALRLQMNTPCTTHYS